MDFSIGDVSIGDHGHCAVQTIIESHLNIDGSQIKQVSLLNWNTTPENGAPYGITGNGAYLFGKQNTTYFNIQVRVWYV